MSGGSFGLIGAAGYVARRHMQAIRDVGGTLQAALDPSDSVGIIDSFFPDAAFFTEFERFDRHVDLLRRSGRPIRHFSICSPNYLHDAHCRFALRAGADAICEKPLVLNPWNVDGLAEMERATGQRIYTILQLRLHPAVRALRERIDGGCGNRTPDRRSAPSGEAERGAADADSARDPEPLVQGRTTLAPGSSLALRPGKQKGARHTDIAAPASSPCSESHAQSRDNRIHEVELTYIAGRGRWYGASWKGDVHKSGGIATNIGIHFFDMLIHVFGGVERSVVHLSEETRSAGWLELERARVRWFLSIDRGDLPERAGATGATYRSIVVDGEAFEFSDGFTDLHGESYRRILAGDGFGIADARPSIEAVARIREAAPETESGERHPFLARRA